jgi:putative toxin-antitoxin system antitoxin component (TIGR02293 family)
MALSTKKPAETTKSATRATSKNAALNDQLMRDSSSVFVGDVSEVIARMRNGIPADVIAVFAADLGISEPRLLDLLRLSERRNKVLTGTNAGLPAVVQDRLYRAWRVLKRAVDVLESQEAAGSWLSCANRSLGGEAPLALLDTEVGYELVLATLGRVEHGVVS